MPAQAGENPAFYHLPGIRPMDRLHVASCSFHCLYNLFVASRYRFVKADGYAFGRSVSFTGIREKAYPDIKFVSESTVRIILRAARINLLRYAYCPTSCPLVDIAGGRDCRHQQNNRLHGNHQSDRVWKRAPSINATDSMALSGESS